MRQDESTAHAHADHPTGRLFDAVVVGVDEDESTRDALALAQQLLSGDGELWLVYVELVEDKPASDSGAAWHAEMREYALQRLRTLRDQACSAAYVSCVEARSIRHGLHEFAVDQRADLLVVGTSRRDEASRTFLGDGTREVLEDPPCAVAVAPAGYGARAAAIRTVGVAYDGSPGSDRALGLARRLEAELNATLSVFEAVKPRCGVRDVSNIDGDDEQDVAQARMRIAALGGVDPHAESAEDAVDALRRFDACVDLLVVGPHRFTPLDRFLQRTTSQRLADAPTHPLLVLAAGGRVPGAGEA